MPPVYSYKLFGPLASGSLSEAREAQTSELRGIIQGIVGRIGDDSRSHVGRSWEGVRLRAKNHQIFGAGNWQSGQVERCRNGGCQCIDYNFTPFQADTGRFETTQKIMSHPKHNTAPLVRSHPWWSESNRSDVPEAISQANHTLEQVLSMINALYACTHTHTLTLSLSLCLSPALLPFFIRA